MASNSAQPAPQTLLFARGVLARLQAWPLLNLAVQSGWGGPKSAEKRTWLAGVLVDAFEGTLEADDEDEAVHGGTGTGTATGAQGSQNGPPDDTYIETLLLQILQDEYDTDIQDGSVEQIARDLCTLYAQAQRLDDEGVKLWEKRAEQARGRKVEVEIKDELGEEEGGSEGEWESDEGEDEEREEQVPPLINHEQRQRRNEPEVDEDGFTVVKKGGKRH